MLVVLGLLISIPIIIWGSTLFIRLMGRFPWIIYPGGGVLACTAAKRIAHEKAVEAWIGERDWVARTFCAIVIICVPAADCAVNIVRTGRIALHEKSRKPQ